MQEVMNIDKIIRRELQYKYLNNVENGLKEYNLTFEELNTYVRCGRTKPYESKPDKVFVDKFGDVKPPELVSACLCGHFIMEQCYLCPKDSKSVDDIIIVGNKCIDRWGFQRAKWGKCEKVECKLCGLEVSKTGIARHQKRPICKKNALHIKADNSTASTCSGDNTVSCSNSEC